MKEKFDILLKKKGLTATSLARILGIQPSGLSHILSGRNKPSFDLVVKILRAFPELNPDWLLLDSDMIFRSAEGNRANNPLFSDDEFSLRSEPLDSSNTNSLFSEDKAEAKNETSPIFHRSANGSKDVERIVVLYTDGSFDSYAK